MFNTNEVLETINMIEREHLDIRTVTMGISLMPCLSGSAEATAKKVYDTICKRAENIVKNADKSPRKARQQKKHEFFLYAEKGFRDNHLKSLPRAEIGFFLSRSPYVTDHISPVIVISPVSTLIASI